MLNLISAIHGTGVAASTNSYESIATVSGNGSSGTITFSSIPSTYKHLQIRGIGRNTVTGVTDNYSFIRFNGDTGNNYAWHILDGNGSSAYASAASTTSSAGVPTFPTAQSTTNIYGVLVLDILDYTNTNKNKTVRYLGGHDQNGSGILRYGSGLWMNTSAITSVTFTFNSDSWTSLSTFALYGIK